ncbi:MAG: heparinase II/III family protein [Phycisphaerae bacterium]|nr:heparinase II/III family protein [Phycisphaerae bacterium]
MNRDSARTEMGWVSVLACLAMATPAVAAKPRMLEAVDAERVQAVAAWLPAEPAGMGVPAADRAAWKPLVAKKAFQAVVTQAEKSLEQPLPELPDELYLDYSKTGNRDRWQRVASVRDTRLTRLVLAECLEHKGRFVAAIAENVRALCAEPTWVMPAHDRSLTNFKGEAIDIDLRSSHIGLELATADYLLGERLGPEIRTMMREQVKRRVLDPYRDMAAGRRAPNWWITGTNNWNAVCHAGVVGAALWFGESREDRAFFIAAAEKHIDYFLRGFGADGYCSEGVGYWNYGFGNYLLLAEMMHQVTGGRVDLLTDPRARPAALYGANIEIINGICPPFADCAVNSRPSSVWMWYINRRFGLKSSRWERADVMVPHGQLATTMLFAFPNSASGVSMADAVEPKLAPHMFFEQSGIVLLRPGERTACRLGVGLKGGHNAEHHNHNDVGSYIVVLDNETLLVDPGAEVYTARTFSNRRYDSRVLNSYGHPVPIIAGQLQPSGAKACGEIIRTDFTGATDTVVLDMTSAYTVPELKKLQRTFVYSREAAGSLTVTDEVVFTEAKPFGTAVMTLSLWEQLAPGVVRIWQGDKAVRVEIKVTGSEFALEPETIDEDVRTRSKPIRLGITLTQPVTEATVTMTITPTQVQAK